MSSEAELQKELNSDPEYLPALMAQADSNKQRGEIKPATEIYNGILRRWPDFAPAQKRPRHAVCQGSIRNRYGL